MSEEFKRTSILRENIKLVGW